MKYMRLRNPPWFLLSDTAPIPGVENPELVSEAAVGSLNHMAVTDSLIFPTPGEANIGDRAAQKHVEPLHYLNLLRRLQQEQPPKSMIEKFSSGYQDYLQAPLQPLTDNLESITYEVFEKDPVKYDLYSQALERALMDWRTQGKASSGPHNKIVVAVVGAGRGPLVTRALQASQMTGIPIDLWALEKNPSAYVLLERHNLTLWSNQVHLVRSDMRSWKGPTSLLQDPHCTNGLTRPVAAETPRYPIDILVSELLGSFADNELSPECLDGITPLLNPSHGISIPCSYSSYLTPLAAPKLHTDILSRTITDKEAPGTPYVVMLQAVDFISNTAQPSSHVGRAQEDIAALTVSPTANISSAWSFNHKGKTSTRSDNEHNERRAHLAFPIKDRAACHGLAGFFEAVLYPGIELSTHPENAEQKSAGMMSWFPIYFPLKVCNHGSIN